MKRVNINKINITTHIDFSLLRRAKPTLDMKSISILFKKMEDGSMSSHVKSKFAYKMRQVIRKKDFLGYVHKPYFVDIKPFLASKRLDNHAIAYFFYQTKANNGENTL